MPNNYIVSLTTIPSKFDNIYKTLDSIIIQTLLPEKIIINIPKVYNFRMNNTEIPLEKIDDILVKYANHNVVINIIDKDYGPGTKLLGLLTSDINIFDDLDNNMYVVLIDDDVIYQPKMIEYFDNYVKTNVNNPINAGSFCTYTYNITLGHGVDGFFIKLNILSKFLQYYDVIKNEDYVNYHDDYYISYYLSLLNITVHRLLTPDNSVIYNCHSQTFIDALCGLKGKYERNNLNFKLTEILNNFNSQNMFSFLC